ncbi:MULTISPECIES: L,D-transpeptidase family protein [unclassified Streptomyces]|uniref:L,D-transpeptidase family protein n=1 Tax=unclassified Streptomyces TaxID=2593676 RepID=UPI002DD985F0|nr:L,D-transpeptidase family protein [Streptomyces sp. NBC_01237]WRZ73587.1 L,D-transpeptidase family protein [Streptomyces sp. NBC_01237]
MPVPRRPYVLFAAPFVLLALLLTGCSREAADSTAAALAGPPGGAAGPESAAMAGRATPTQPARPQEIPYLGPGTRGLIPSTARQALVVTGEAADSNRSTAVLYTRDGPTKSWRPAAGPWPAHNGMRGWTDLHMADDLKSPNGVYTLTDAGGRLPDPGSLLPYDEQPHFAVSGDGFFGEPLEGSFDYVVAINYNRTPGVTPLDRTRPLGMERGGGIWIHVDHGGPTQGCVSLPEERMEELLRTLDPAKNPVIVMGDAAALER